MRQNLNGYLFLLPALVVFAIFVWYPIGLGFVISFQHIDLLNPPTWAGVWLPEAASAFNILVLKSFFDGIPSELVDAARIDGANAALPFNYLTAGLVLASIPPIILFLIFQRQIIRGITLTGLKG